MISTLFTTCDSKKKMLYRTTKYFRFIHSHLIIDKSLFDFPKIKFEYFHSNNLVFRIDLD